VKLPLFNAFRQIARPVADVSLTTRRTLSAACGSTDKSTVLTEVSASRIRSGQED